MRLRQFLARIRICAALFCLIYLVASIRSRFYSTNQKVVDSKLSSSFAVFVVVESPYETKDLIASKDDTTTMLFTNITEMTINRLESLPCEAVRNLQLFVLFTTDYDSDSSPSLTEDPIPQDWIRSFERCSWGFKTSFLTTNKSTEASTLRRVVFDAYLDNVEYFYVALLDGQKDDFKMKIDLVKKREVLRKSSHEVGIVVDEESISNVFFSKTHLEIFGSAFPVTIGDLRMSFDYLVRVYLSEHLAVVTSNNEEILKISRAPPDTEPVLTDQWKDQYIEDILTLQR